MTEKQQRTLPDVDLDNGLLVNGMFFGFVLGAVITLFTFPKRLRTSRKQLARLPQALRENLPTPTDPLEESLEAGKAAARRRREALRENR